MNTICSLVPVYKPVGKIPLECVQEYKSRYLLDPNITVSYAGRLDPMAEGILLLLVGDTNKKRREYEHLSKEYEVTVLVGFATDTGDLMGKITKSERRKTKEIRQELMKMLPLFVGPVEQRYPIYSSAKVRGKPLYWWARKGRLNEIEVPTHKVQIDKIEIISSNNSVPKATSSFQIAIGNPLTNIVDPRIESEDDVITKKELLQYIIRSVGSVQGDFRQDEIISKWQEVLGEDDNLTKHTLFTFHITCGSGTYMRQLVMDIGERIGAPLCAYKIKRTRVGKYTMKNCMRLEIASSLDNSSQ